MDGLMDLWVVYGSGNKGELKEMLEAAIPDMLLLMDFNQTLELTNLELKAIKGKRSIDSVLGELTNNQKIKLMEGLHTESLEWVKLMEQAHDDARLQKENRRCSVFVVQSGLEVFCKVDGLRKTFSLDKVLRNHLGYQSRGSDGVKLRWGYHSIQQIHPYERGNQVFIIWPQSAYYEDDLLRFTGQNTVLVTDGLVTKLQVEKARPRLILSPFPVDPALLTEGGISSILLKDITTVKL